jgi:CRISPR-associated endonuclease/helicase Cas3
MAQLEARKGELAFPFASIAKAFRLIDDAMTPVLIPYDEEAKTALNALEHASLPPAGVLRTLQRYTVSVPERVRRSLLATGAACVVHPEVYGDRFVRLVEMSQYDESVGLRLDDPTYRTAESLIFS